MISRETLKWIWKRKLLKSQFILQFQKWNMTENFSLKALVGLSDVFSYNWAKRIKNIGRLTNLLTGRLTNWETGRLTNWKTDKLTNWETGRLADWQTDADWNTIKLTGLCRLMDFQTDRLMQTVRLMQSDRLMQTDRLIKTDRLSDWLKRPN